jgi:hypothetical protein
LVLGWTNADFQGMFETLSVGATMRMLAGLTVTNWVARGNQFRARYGLTNSCQISLQTAKGVLSAKGDKPSVEPAVEIGSVAPPDTAYGAVSLDGDLWIFTFDPLLYQCIELYLPFPP